MNRIIINTIDPASGVKIDSEAFAAEQIKFLTNSFLNKVSGYLYINGILKTEVTVKKPFVSWLWGKIKAILNYKLI